MKAFNMARLALQVASHGHHRKRSSTHSPFTDEAQVLLPTPRYPKNLRLSCLDEDSLYLIVLEVYSQGDLKQFTQVSRRVRYLSKPVLFKRCRVACGGPHGFLPSNLWPYVCVLIYHGGTYHNLANAGRELAHMSQLHTVIFRDIFGSVPWAVLKACLRAPALRALEIRHSSWSRPNTFPADDVAATQIALKKFVYRIYEWRDVSRHSNYYAPSVPEMLINEALCLGPLVLQMNDTIEHLTVTSEALSYGCMSTRPWPKLRELSLYGACPTLDNPTLFLSRLSMMPQLRLLSLRLSRSRLTEDTVVWPRDSAVDSATLAQLESFTLAYPSLNETAFAHLPDGLRHLSLRDHPRYYHTTLHFAPRRYPGTTPLISASECHRMLRQCHIRALDSLELVYREDEGDSALLWDIVTRFPLLSTLEIHRYRATNEMGVDVESIAAILALLRHLRVLRMHVDLPNPLSYHDACQGLVFEFKKRIDRCAQIFAEKLSDTLEEVHLLFLSSTNAYQVWRVDRLGVGAPVLRPVPTFSSTENRDGDIPL